MPLSPMPARFPGRCASGVAVCKRRMQVGETIYYDRAARLAYCEPCGKRKQQEAEAAEDAGPGRFDDCWELFETLWVTCPCEKLPHRLDCRFSMNPAAQCRQPA
jgi:hypothetical protein